MLELAVGSHFAVIINELFNDSPSKGNDDMPRLNKRAVDAALVGFTWDSELPGFGLRVLATGRRSYVVRYINSINSAGHQNATRATAAILAFTKKAG